ncbi:unnamed protein product [Dovyalis caffra]|uniref:Uncharacterized protein n=1 Tax=Dovyalis caffra TaxID=77055 RepID=A0AAV1SCS7_9ROSI|nr:unnamed protein product [Dovyalis caffra]
MEGRIMFATMIMKGQFLTQQIRYDRYSRGPETHRNHFALCIVLPGWICFMHNLTESKLNARKLCPVKPGSCTNVTHLE